MNRLNIIIACVGLYVLFGMLAHMLIVVNTIINIFS